MNDATTGAIRIVQVNAPGATSRTRWTRRWPLLRDAVLATSSYPSATREGSPDCSGRAAGRMGIRIGAKVANAPCWRYTGGRVRRADGFACPTLRRRGGKLSAHL